MTEGSKPNKNKKLKKLKQPADKIDFDWRDSTKPRNPEDDVIWMATTSRWNL